MKTKLAGLLSLSTLLLLTSAALARQGAPPPSLQRQLGPLTTVKQVVLHPTDVAAEKAADAQKTGKGPGPMRFAVPQALQITPATHGTWETTPEGRVWRLRLVSAGATDMNLGFSSFRLPEGATLHISSESDLYYQGPYTAEDNKPHGQLWTAMVPGPAAVVELFVPAGVADPKFILTQAATGYRDWFGKDSGVSIPKSGACNIDVVCPQGLPWTNQIRSVGVYTVGGIWTCTGTLLANANAATPYRNFFLTANHCDLNTANAPSVVVYWNFQSPTCGALGGGSLAQNQSGAVFRAARADVDVALIELEETPEPSFGVYYSGWDRSGAAVSSAVGIHHPNTDEKAISFSNGALSTGNSCIGSGGISSHWLVTWAQGTTEPGSSGSAIFDASTKRVVGFLSGGEASCSFLGGTDCYGKVYTAWTGGTSAAQRLKEWLDPLNTGVTFVNGVDPATATVIAPSAWTLVAEACAPGNGNLDPNEPVTISFTLRNFGGITATNLVATLLTSGGVANPSGPQNYGLLASGASASRTFSFAANVSCGTAVQASLQLQDGPRNLGTVVFTLPTGAPSTFYTENFDSLSFGQLPAGWTTTSYLMNDWYATDGVADTLPNSAYAASTDAISDKYMTSANILIAGANSQLEFRHYYNVENGFDGCALEISINNGVFEDIILAGGTFTVGGYNDFIFSDYGNPLGDRYVWTGNSGGFVSAAVTLPPTAAGKNVRFRWRLGSDASVPANGWYVDSIKLTSLNSTCCTYVALNPVQLTSARHIPPSSMAFSFNTESGRSYVIEAAPTVTGTWQPVATNAGTGAVQSYTNSTQAPAARYFRVITR